MNFVSSIAGSVEAQARWALHVHFLLAALGFQTPEDLRKVLAGDFAAGVQRLWSWISSIYWRSPEGFASYLNEPSAMEALRVAELVPLKRKQRDLIGKVYSGEDRVAQSRSLQLVARGISDERAGDARPRTKFMWFTPDFYGDQSLSASEWAAACSEDFNAGVIDSGNHECKPDVCYKGKLGKRGWCRMRFFHNAQVAQPNGEAVFKMVHGAQLVPRWSYGSAGGASPPIADESQWNAGEPLVEQNQPFIGPLMGAMYGGPRCNHHVSVLLRLPPVTGTEPICAAAQAERVNAAIALIAKLLNDANHYCGDYCGKAQPQMDNLFRHLAQAQAGLLKSLDDLREDDPAEAVLYRAKRVVYRMMNVCARRMHKGMPEMVSYLLDEEGECPEFFCSHSFRPVFVPMLLSPYEAAVAQRSLAVGGRPSVAAEMTDMVFGDDGDDDTDQGDVLQYRNARVDYECRPSVFAEWPFYFFQAGVGIVPRSKDTAYIFSARHPLHKKLALRVRTQSAWKVPLLYGPAVPSTDDDPHRRAVLLQLLLRPWQAVSDLLPADGREVTQAWVIAYFQAWYDGLVQTRQTWLSNPARSKRPPRLTEGSDEESKTYWAFQTLRIMRNIDLLPSKRLEQSLPAPLCSVGAETGCDEGLPGGFAGSQGSSDSEEQRATLGEVLGNGSDGDGDGEAFFGDADGCAVSSRHERCEEQRCGMPSMTCDIGDLATGRATGGGSGAESLYSARLQRIAAERLPRAERDRHPWPPHCTPCLRVDVEAVAKFQSFQEALFATADDCSCMDTAVELDPVNANACVVPRIEVAVIEVLDICASVQPGPVVVLESAFHLVETGLLNVPGAGRVNRKQALSFLHFASWVQRKKNEDWVAEGVLHCELSTLQPLRAVTLGGPGTGKTTLNSICKAFARFWLGEDSVRTGALSHAAARIAAGRTFHSMYRLPRRNMRDRTAGLAADALARYKEEWRAVEVEFKDEISMVGCDVYFQMYIRSLTAKRGLPLPDGRVVPNIASLDSGDFMQLPPVEKLALFEDVPLPVDVADPLSNVTPCAQDERRGNGGSTTDGKKKGVKVTRDDAQATYLRECYWGQQYWRGAAVVTFLDVNTRSDLALAQILDEMRQCRLSKASYGILQSRVVGTRLVGGCVAADPPGVLDPRLTREPFNDPNEPPVHIVFRHYARAALAYQNALFQAERQGRRL